MNDSKSIKSSNSKYTSISMVKIMKRVNICLLTSIAPNITMTIFGGGDGYLLKGVIGGMGVSSLTSGLLEEGLLERFFLLYLYVCMSGNRRGWKLVLNQVFRLT